MLHFTSHTKELTLPDGPDDKGMSKSGNPTVRALLTVLLKEAGIEGVADKLKGAPNQDFLNTNVEIVTQDGHELASSDDTNEQGIKQVTVLSGGIIDTNDGNGGIETDVTPSALRLIADDARRDKITD